ncbi:S-adenosylmethionine-dependent methyltransferase Rv2258c-like [Mya arenaria]|uniref:S-adenosylmethionine-dependent methyltransferase Rv2258c-like n=1 Tax=Mya arenaria TaxID=6604 RepID=UPI0022E1C6C6|nr:S-adenosylmethionine-dependent methyltransferase Rv2258c-like [Mya arenaria]
MATGGKYGMDQDAFSQYLTGIYGGGCVMLSVAIGHELGLFKAICEAPGPFSSEGIAGKLNFKPRYTKEWRSTMVAAGILQQDRNSRLYNVPEGHKSALLRNTGFAPILISLSTRADLIKKCFQENGPYGISFAESPEWFEWFYSFRGQTVEHKVNTVIVPVWKKQSDIVPRLENGINVLDLGCGPGNFTNILAQRFPNSTFVGLDYSDAAIEIANRDKANRGLFNMTFMMGDAYKLPDDWTGDFDMVLRFSNSTGAWARFLRHRYKNGQQRKADRGLSKVTFMMGDAHKLPEDWAAHFDMVFVYDVLHDLTHPYNVLKQIHRILKPNGFLSLIDFGFHSDPVENAGDMTAAMYYSCSVFRLLASCMTEELWVGFGACWGREEIQKAILGAGFQINGESSPVVIEKHFFFCCTK